MGNADAIDKSVNPIFTFLSSGIYKKVLGHLDTDPSCVSAVDEVYY